MQVQKTNNQTTFGMNLSSRAQSIIYEMPRRGTDLNIGSKIYDLGNVVESLNCDIYKSSARKGFIFKTKVDVLNVEITSKDARGVQPIEFTVNPKMKVEKLLRRLKNNCELWKDEFYRRNQWKNFFNSRG